MKNDKTELTLEEKRERMKWLQEKYPQTLVSKMLEHGERLGFAVSNHPTGTALIKNFREYVLLFPQEDGSVIYEVREPLYPPSKREQTSSDLELRKVVKELR